LASAGREPRPSRRAAGALNAGETLISDEVSRPYGTFLQREVRFMHPRIDTARVSQAAYKAMRALQAFVDATGLEQSLRELVNIRASQINACAFCLHMHLRDARKAGESQERLDLIGAWREAPVFSSRERAALAWTEAVTLVAATHVPDDIYEAARAEFSEQELVDLTMAVVTINGWNRLMVSFRIPPAVAGRV
jgi:AhpD family alkylhydroperoxidase